MSEQGWLYDKFWAKMDEWTQTRPLTPEARAKYERDRRQKSAKKLSENISEVREFLDDVQDLIHEDSDARRYFDKLNRSLSIFQHSVEFGEDAAEAAQEVSQTLTLFYNMGDTRCKRESKDDADAYYTCLATTERQWQKNNVDYVLNVNNPNSWVNRLWPKWRRRILALLSPL